MTDALIVMNVRDIHPVKQAFAQLPIAKIWLTGYTEAQLAESVFEYAIRETDFDRYLVCSDDILVRQPTLDAVTGALDGGCEVATGYSQRTHTDWTVNVTNGPLRDSHPASEAYRFMKYRDVVSWPEPLVPTWFAGFSLTGMSRDMWQRFPFGCFTEGQPTGYASDFHLSRRLQDERIPIYAVREAFAYHWRHEWQHTNHPEDDPVLLGELEPAVTVEPAARLVCG